MKLSNWTDISRKKILIMVNRFSSSLVISELKLKPWQHSILLLLALMVFKFKDNCWCYWEKEPFVMTYISKTRILFLSEDKQTDRHTSKLKSDTKSYLCTHSHWNNIIVKPWTWISIIIWVTKDSVTHIPNGIFGYFP